MVHFPFRSILETAVIALLLLASCAADRGTLGLAGYQSLSIVEVKVTGEVPYAHDKLTEDIRSGLCKTIEDNRHWSRKEKPTANISVVITEGYEPTDVEQTIIGVPYSLGYTLMAKDADTGVDLGQLSSKSRARVRSSILIEGSDSALLDRNFERGWSEGSRHNSIIGRAVIDMEKQLTNARRRPPPTLGAPRTQ